MVSQCPKCGSPLRLGAKFCPSCRHPVAAQAAPQQSYSSPPAYAPPSASGQGQGPALIQQAGQTARQAAAAAAPVARAAGGAAWRASRKGMGWFARLITLGGRAAYTEVFSPPAVAEGQVNSQPTFAYTPAPLESAAFVFVLSFALLPLIFLIKDWRIELAVFAGGALLLLALNFAGLRWPAFSRITFGHLFRRYPGGNVPEARFQVHDAQKGVLNLRIVGARRENVQIAFDHLVRVYGMPEPGRNEIRVWKAEVYAANGQPLGIVTAPRLLPLFATLFAPTVLWFIVWLVVRIAQIA